jgi:hypothetical protein
MSASAHCSLPELPQVMIKVAVIEHAPFFRRHFSEKRVFVLGDIFSF